MIKRLYKFLLKITSKPDERGEYSAGHWQDMVRGKVLELCSSVKGNFIDVGCGEGLFLSKLAKNKRELNIYGIDIWDEILKKSDQRLRKNGISNVTLKVMDISKMTFENDFFDTIVCVNVFFNLHSDTFYKSLDEITRICKKEGRIIFDIRNKANVFLWLKYKLAKFYDQTVKDLPLKTYSLKDVTSLFKDKGFRVDKVISIGFPKGRFSPIYVVEAVKL